jgi:hypothetical protein
MHLQELLNDLSIYSILLPLITGCCLLKYISRDSYLVLGVVVLAAVPQLLKPLELNDRLEAAIYNLYTLCEFILFFILFNSKIYHPLRKRIMFTTFITGLLLIIFCIIWFGIKGRFYHELVCLTNLLYTSWILLVILDQYETEDAKIGTSTPFFWYLTGLLFYAPCTIFVFSLWNYIEDHQESPLKIIHNIFNLTMYILFTKGIWKDYQVNKKP